MVHAGLRWGLFAFLGLASLTSIKPCEITSYEEAVPIEETYSLEEDFEQVNTSSLSDLLTFDQYKGGKGKEVAQEEAIFIDPEGAIDALYTRGSTSCPILIAMARDPDGELKRIGMAHIDRKIRYDSIKDFYDMLKTDNSQSIDAYVINGVEENALKILRVSREEEVNIEFFNTGMGFGRGDSAIVDRQGNVYYGNFDELFTSPVYLGDDEFEISLSKVDVLSGRAFENPSGDLVFME